MNNLEINIVDLQIEELETITGGDRLTRAFFSWLGDMAAVLGNAMESDAQHGVTGHI
ncbi:hypothetical protein [Flavobacterium muglaense]|uniref:Uncharacterized protein n=1 Tax=Flavobacterium muglaense TaxID=2764716 RepID=A0A923SEU9_9FLAO|nr:hypothetical protein [Flavobacterium muglaense]MBC5837286.1 hypothetical protein [Flavobacterium muglaense]MBC5843790.1 hypothetical protein [Flavobacterium muglaense]